MGSKFVANWLVIYIAYLRRIVKLLVGFPINFLADTI